VNFIKPFGVKTTQGRLTKKKNGKMKCNRERLILYEKDIKYLKIS
jgi:hypothetical protein